jgi:hypothetical protein
LIIIAGVYTQSNGNIAYLQAKTDAYKEIEQVLGSGGYEVPDCGHPGKHITVVDDTTLGKKVFAF